LAFLSIAAAVFFEAYFPFREYEWGFLRRWIWLLIRQYAIMGEFHFAAYSFNSEKR
jgi:hypothetical protein